MTAVTLNKSELMAPAVMQTMQQRSLVIGAIGAVATIAGWFLAGSDAAKTGFFSAYLIGYMFWLGLALGCMAILMLYHLVGGKWGTVIRRILEAGMTTLPMMAILFIPIGLNLPKLYAWARPEELAKDPKLADLASSYLNPTGIWTRAVIYFAIWIVMAFLLSKWSSEQDTPAGGEKSTLRFRALSGPGLVIYSFSISFAVIDWVMSLQARWISTIYGFIFIVGEVLSAYCFVVIIERILTKRKPMAEYVTPKELNDHGNFMLTFVMLWTYFSFSQLLIIWAGNLPDEISWFVRRFNGGWGPVELFLALFHFAVPFALLLSKSLKRNARKLAFLASWLMFVRIVDIFWHVEPANFPTFHLSWVLFAVLAGMGGLWIWYFLRNLRSRPLLALYAPQTLKHLGDE